MDAGKQSSGAGRLAAVSTGLALLSCYGTTALIGLFSLLGVNLALNVRLWAATIVLLAGLTAVGLLLQVRRHGRVGPFAAAVLGFGLLTWVMLRSYDPRLEAAGFIVLSAAILWDRIFSNSATKRDGPQGPGFARQNFKSHAATLRSVVNRLPPPSHNSQFRSLPVAARNDGRPDAQSSAVSGAHSLRLERPSGARCLRRWRE